MGRGLQRSAFPSAPLLGCEVGSQRNSVWPKADRTQLRAATESCKGASVHGMHMCVSVARHDAFALRECSV